MRIRGDVRPNPTHQYVAPFMSLRSIELPPAIPEAADRRRFYFAAGIDVQLTPLARVGVVDEEGHSFPVPLWAIGLDFLHPGLASPKGMRGFCALQFHLMRPTLEGVLHLGCMCMPPASGEVEVM